MGATLPVTSSWWTLIDARAALTPERTFLSDAAGRTVSFGQYRQFAEEVAAGLMDLGVDAPDVVSWQLPTTIEAAVLMAALSRLGVRQNPIIPILRRAEVAHITGQLGTRWMIVPGTYRDFDFVDMAHQAVPAGCTVIDTSAYRGDAELGLPRADPSALPAFADPGPGERWYYYSSGTTASPKGARHTDASAMASSHNQVELIDLQPDDVYPVAFPITHIGGIMVLTSYLRVGAQLLLLDAFDPVHTPPLMAARGATILGSATPFFQAYLAAQRAHGPDPLFPRLRHLQSGGAPITPELAAECLRVLGVEIYNQWGLTEFPAATSLAPGDPADKFAATVGRMSTGAEVEVRDFDGAPVPRGTEGELWVRGPQRCLGYVDPALDAEAFDDAGWFRTGDLGTVDTDGFVRITGRLKDIIIRNAENLSAQEIEDVVAEHPAVADVAVVGVPDPLTGERACAVVVLSDGSADLTIADLAEHCVARGLAKQKIPEQLQFAEVLPRNPMGKVLKHVLRAQLAGEVR